MKKFVVFAVLVCTTFSVGAFPDAKVWYKICNFRSGKYLQPANPVKYPGVNGVNIVQMTADASCYNNSTNLTPYQEWKFVPVTGSSGYYFIQNKYTSLVMNISGNSKTPGANNIQYSNTNGYNEQWQIIAPGVKGFSGNQLYNIKNRNSGQVLDIKGDLTSDNDQCIQNNSTGATNQQWLIEDATPWTQTQFIIGAWDVVNADANLNTTYFNNLKNCNFSTIVYSGEWQPDNSCLFMTHLTSTYSSPNLYSNSLPPFCNSTDYSKLVPAATSSFPSLESLLNLAMTAGVKVLVNPDNGVGTIAGDYLDPINISDAQCKLDANYNASFFKNFSKYRAQMLGYFIADEPAEAIPTAGIRANLIKDQLAASDPGKLGYLNLLSYGYWETPQYETYVDGFVSKPSTRAISFDYYLFEDGVNTSGFYISDALTNVTYFYTLNVFASTIKKYKDQYGKYTMFWGNCGHSCEEHGIGGLNNNLPYNYPFPTEAMLRYYASSSLIYGAKAMIWYTYAANPPSIPTAIVDNNNNPSQIYSLIQTINGELAKMGPTLMTLSWVKTIHGTATDPCTQEQYLPIQIGTDDYFTQEYYISPPNNPASGWNQGYSAIGILKPSSGSDYYLLIMNKWLKYNAGSAYPNEYSGTIFNARYTVTGRFKKISQFDKINSTPTLSGQKWNSVTPIDEYGTSFDLGINPGDVALIRVTN